MRDAVHQKLLGTFLEHIKMHKHTPNEATKKLKKENPRGGLGTTLAQGSCRVDQFCKCEQMQRSL